MENQITCTADFIISLADGFYCFVLLVLFLKGVAFSNWVATFWGSELVLVNVGPSFCCKTHLFVTARMLKLQTCCVQH